MLTSTLEPQELELGPRNRPWPLQRSVPESVDCRVKGLVTEVKMQVCNVFCGLGPLNRLDIELTAFLLCCFFFLGKMWFLLGLQCCRSFGGAAEEDHWNFSVPECPEPGRLCYKVQDLRLSRWLHDQCLPLCDQQSRH